MRLPYLNKRLLLEIEGGIDTDKKDVQQSLLPLLGQQESSLWMSFSFYNYKLKGNLTFARM